MTSVSPSSPSSVFCFLVAFRLLNAFTIHTFFQPDEFFQSLEPAWQIAFGRDSGTWITWEWRHYLRSSLHPLLFAGAYYLVAAAARILQLAPATRAELLIAAPKALQAVTAAVGDYYTWKLARRVYGEKNEARAALALTVLSPWQWFCSTRTLSNCLETTLTVAALYLWPWEWSLGSTAADEPKPPRSAGRGRKDRANLTRLRQCLCLAALACILRPTNGLIWVSLASVALLRGSWNERMALVREVAICGSVVLSLSALADRLFYGVWTFPPLRFLYFNLAQSLAVFYGKNDWHYYLSQGYPLLLTTALPFTLVGLYRALVAPSTLYRLQMRITLGRLQMHMQTQLASICIIMPLVLSLISHKEVRFIYPLLPSLHVLTAPVLVNYFFPAVYRSSRVYTPRRLILLFLLFANIVIALYTTVYHASGALNVVSYLRQQQQTHSQNPSSGIAAESPGISAGFLMPCHSTPWRSHLVYPDIHAWALSCEPPVGLDEAQKSSYLDEADQFYANPAEFLRQNMEGGLRHVPGKPSYLSPPPGDHQDTAAHPWPDYLAFFAQLEPTLNSLLRASAYAECWRTFNTQWHDDWRRRGDIIVWCLDPAEQLSWHSRNRKRTLDSRKRSFDNILNRLKSDSRKRSFDNVLDMLKSEISSSGRRKSPFQRWMANNDWHWPWAKQRRSSWVPELPEWVKNWRSGMPQLGGKWKSKSAVERERDLWS